MKAPDYDTNLTRSPVAERLTEVVDVGANPIDGVPPYAPMLSAGLCRVTGFEPQEFALRDLLQKMGSKERYLPYAVGDGRLHVLTFYRASGSTRCTSQIRDA